MRSHLAACAILFLPNTAKTQDLQAFACSTELAAPIIALGVPSRNNVGWFIDGKPVEIELLSNTELRLRNLHDSTLLILEVLGRKIVLKGLLEGEVVERDCADVSIELEAAIGIRNPELARILEDHHLVQSDYKDQLTHFMEEVLEYQSDKDEYIAHIATLEERLDTLRRALIQNELSAQDRLSTYSYRIDSLEQELAAAEALGEGEQELASQTVILERFATSALTLASETSDMPAQYISAMSLMRKFVENEFGRELRDHLPRLPRGD